MLQKKIYSSHGGFCNCIFGQEARTAVWLSCHGSTLHQWLLTHDFVELCFNIFLVPLSKISALYSFCKIPCKRVLYSCRRAHCLDPLNCTFTIWPVFISPPSAALSAPTFIFMRMGTVAVLSQHLYNDLNLPSRTVITWTWIALQLLESRWSPYYTQKNAFRGTCVIIMSPYTRTSSCVPVSYARLTSYLRCTWDSKSQTYQIFITFRWKKQSPVVVQK